MSSRAWNSVELRVEEAKEQEDINRGIARISKSVMDTVGVTQGDILEILGTKLSAARAGFGFKEDDELPLVRIDSFIRNNCGVEIGDRVTVRRADALEAMYVQVATSDVRIAVDADFMSFAKDCLMDRPLAWGDKVPLRMLGHSIPFVVVDTRPDGIVSVTRNTQIHVLGEPAYKLGTYFMPKNSLIEVSSTEALESLRLAIGRSDMRVDLVKHELTLYREITLTFGRKSVSRFVKLPLRRGELYKAKEMSDQKEEDMGRELEAIKKEVRELLELSGSPIKVSIFQILEKLVAISESGNR